MVNVKPASVRLANYKRAIPGVAASYKDGIEKTNNWQAQAVAAQGLYEEKMRSPEILARRAKGLSKVNDADWKNAALAKGVTRITQGMEAGANKQVANFEPYAAALSGLTLQARTADPMTNIDNRVKAVVQTLVNVKKQQG